MSRVIDLGSGKDLDEKRTTEEILEAEDFSTRIINASVDGIVACDRALRFTIFNPAMEKLTGRRRGDVMGRAVFDLFPELGEQGVFELYRRALAGERIDDEARTYHTPDGRSVCLERYLSPLVDEEGQIVGVLNIIRDVTDRYERLERAEENARELERRVRARTLELENVVEQLKHEAEDRSRAESALRFLAEAGVMLAASTDFGTTLRNVLQLSGSHFGGWSLLRLDEPAQRVAVAEGAEAIHTHDAGAPIQSWAWHPDPIRRSELEAVSREFRDDPDLEGTAAWVARTGQSVWIPCATEKVHRSFARDEDHLQNMLSLGAKAYICVPLSAGGRTLGALAVISSERFYTAHDLRVAEELARRCALAIDTSRLIERLRGGK